MIDEVRHDDDHAVDAVGAGRARLLALRDGVVSRLHALGVSRDDVVRAAQGSNLDDEHDPEGATIAFEREQLRALTTQAAARLVEIDDALARLEDGSYGTCDVCGEPIGEARLEARPTASRCIRHA
ncbi:TraR/DksA family transcriptional regulator [Serinibacter arcticus]|uniref:DnaK suppressor protein n=1 Tax=Serinibacter arcticus TaxID=1655435 RepID=A0A4Z1DXS9_9MICO|nr:TraR/DksA C4-type zinc finger protein [Serinibacter arcticus]TGO04434.1 DnaK suppressor protein [Serinibacter arcticus]